MKHRSLLLLSAIFLFIAIAFIWVNLLEKNDKALTAKSSETDGFIIADKETIKSKDQAWKKFKLKWDSLLEEHTGPALDQARRDMLKDVVRWGCSGDTNLLLDYLKEEEFVALRSQFILEFSNSQFAGGITMAHIEWLNLVRNQSARHQLFEECGKYCRDEKHLSELLTHCKEDVKNQAKLVTGYALSYVQKDPLLAIDLILKKTPKNTEFNGLIALMWNLPDDCDFAAISAKMPGDDKYLAKQSRRIMLHKWAMHDPRKAGEYVVTSGKILHPDQMRVVIDQWCKKSADEAEQWLSTIDSKAVKDEGLLALVHYLQKGQPQKAFTICASINDKAKRLTAATEAFNEWAKIDRKAAEAAWVQVFPQ